MRDRIKCGCFLATLLGSLFASGVDLTFSPAESLFWSTPVTPQVSLEVFWPPEAARAEVLVRDGERATTNALAKGTATLTLPLDLPSRSADERILSLTLSFYDSDGVECLEGRREASLALVARGVEGAPARYLPAESPAWQAGHAVETAGVLLPVPPQAESDVLPCRWFFLSPLSTTPVRVSFSGEDAQELCAATLWRLTRGLRLILR
jgi:hypothetical protein